VKNGLEGRAGKAYQRALEAVLAIPIGMGIGYYVGGWLGSAPIGLGVGTVLGFAAFVRRLVSMRSLVEDASPDGDASDDERGDPS
jgi:F0F1-type ATP synthase assembly protein I